MRIIILCLSPSCGGLELYALEEIRQMTQRGHKCFAVVAKDSYMDKSLTKDNIPHAVLKVKFKRFPFVAARKLRTITKNIDADVLHFHWGKDLYLAALFKSILGGNVKLVHSRHMNYTRNKKDILHRWFYNKIDLLLVGSKVLLKLTDDYLPLDKSKVKLLYLGTPATVTDKKNCSILFDKNNFNKRQLNIAIFGRIEEGKGQHIVVDAIIKMRDEKKDISLTMIGHSMDKVYQSRLEVQINNKELAGFIRFKGFVDNATSLMNCFDVIVLSTHCETFGLVLIEAMMAGVAVIGTDAGGVPEIIEQGVSGILVEPRSVASMKMAIEKYYNDTDYRLKLAAAGLSRAEHYFSTETHYPKLERLLLSVLD